jgi:zona occludens toxin
MPITAYTGLMGSGKSYEVTENVILPALLEGRRVVTNVANLQQEEIRAYLIDKFDAVEADIGEIVQLTNDDIDRKDFWPVEVKEGEVAPDSVVKGGDVVVIDECWRWWATGVKFDARHMTFFRMHRHFVHPVSGVCCEIVLVVQDIADLDRKLKVVVETTYRMTKHKALGMSSKYRVDIFVSYKTNREPMRVIQRSYNPDVFRLYQSYSQGGKDGGKEVDADGRANIFKNPLFTIAIPLMTVIALVAGWKVYSFAHPDKPGTATADKDKDKDKAKAAAAAVPVSHAKPAVDVSEEWRAAGYYMNASGLSVVLLNDRRARVLHNPPNVKLYGSEIEALLPGGEAVASWTGTKTGGMLAGAR